MSDLTGEVIDGRYKLNRIVASGGMATIYAATDLRLDRVIAVKIMHPHLAQDEKFVERFIREAKAASGCNALEALNSSKDLPRCRGLVIALLP